VTNRTYKFARRREGVGYKDWMLWIPKANVSEHTIKASLEIIVNDVDRLILWEDADDHILVPREYLWDIGEANVPFPIEYRAPKFEKIYFQDNIQTKDGVQEAAWLHLEKATGGILNLSCGKGKTVLALKKVAQIGKPAIIVVNQGALMEQWLQAIQQFLGIPPEEVGIVQGPRADWQDKKIVVGMIHTLALHNEEWSLDFRQRFGVVVFDEVHHLAAPLFSKTAPLFWGQRFGLTATPERADGTEIVYLSNLGGIFYSDLRPELVPTIYFQQLNTLVDMKSKYVNDRNGDFNISRFRKHLTTLERRNQVMAEHVIRARDNGRRILVLGHIVKGLTRLCALIPEAVQVKASMGQKTRLELFQNETVVASTMKLASEGLDAPQLDTVFFTTPFRSWNDMVQGMGRILRSFPGKNKPVVVVFDDCRVGPAKGMVNALKRGLQRNGYDITIVSPDG
jgi:superfamily II DNA or RNA helicase